MKVIHNFANSGNQIFYISPHKLRIFRNLKVLPLHVDKMWVLWTVLVELRLRGGPLASQRFYGIMFVRLFWASNYIFGVHNYEVWLHKTYFASTNRFWTPAKSFRDAQAAPFTRSTLSLCLSWTLESGRHAAFHASPPYSFDACLLSLIDRCPLCPAG